MGRQSSGTLAVAPELSDGIVITSPGVDLWSDWEEFIASTASPTVVAGFNFPDTSGSVTPNAVWSQIQIGVGAAGLEQPIATYLMRNANENQGPKLFLFDPPMDSVNAGTRIALRHRAQSGASFQYRLIYWTGFDSDHQLGSTTNPLTCVPLPDAGSVVPTCQITPNAVAWAWSDWAELVAASTFVPEIALVALVVETNGTGPHDAEVQVAFGESGAELPITTLRGYAATGVSSAMNTLPFPALYPIEGPNPRIAVRLRKSTTTTDAWSVGLRLYANVTTIPVTPPAPTTTATKIRRLRRSAHLSEELFWGFVSKLQLDLETGVGLSSGQGSDPQIMLRVSHDGGLTWGAERWTSAGAIGDYDARAIWYQLGRGRDLVFEITMTDPVLWAIFDAFIDVKKGSS